MNHPRITQHEFYTISARDVIALELWHAFDRFSKGDADLAFALAHWTQVWGYLPWHLSDEPAGTPMREKTLYVDTLARLSGMGAKYTDTRDCDAFSREAMTVLGPLIDATGREWMRSPPQTIKWFGCIGYTLASAGSRAMLHFYNACCPDSPFEDMDELKDDMRRCLAELGNRGSRVETISCGSWINNLEPFLSLFPESYRASLVATDPDGKSGSGWWGQFLTRTGHVNETRAWQLKRTGEFRYRRKSGQCALDEAIAWVRQPRRATRQHARIKVKPTNRED